MAECIPPSAQVLLVEDNRVNRLLLSRQVEQLGHVVQAVEDGLKALAVLRERRFDLMLLDIEMPGLNGFQVLEQLTADPELREMPVIVTSGLDGLVNVVRCIELGAEDYLHKPVNPVLLRARIAASFEKKRLRDQQRELMRRFATSAVAQDVQRSGFMLGGRLVPASVLFCDIRGFTTLTEALPPEEVIELLNTYYTLMFDAIGAQGGVVNQIIGDGLMAIFGAPQPLEGHAKCAVRAALEMVEMAAEFSREQQAAGGPEIRIGVGIASGDVVAGYTGTQERATYTCVGDTVNRAARLEVCTKEAQRAVLIDGATREQLDAGFELESLGAQQLKGKTQAVEVFAVL
ncbi:adenylate/guanylate cyclase domain-containing response regulator [Pelomonas sp. SE-A7]|uniref:adenylate/guanylate cyclase domain-containing protein n=1 Tax=Pelomonas sp. SE-A7 TaxID=3054953 RepID=UPI00259CC506|nr:adenylate/guanylate cyclase domain-containing response regulator [Pelomonas sp. SE-A7]MDM4767753.1 adenylate/guanylate cyclase domain-containing response regulator [Pelomonas sp. SE-A7]